MEKEFRKETGTAIKERLKEVTTGEYMLKYIVTIAITALVLHLFIIDFLFDPFLFHPTIIFIKYTFLSSYWKVLMTIVSIRITIAALFVSIS